MIDKDTSPDFSADETAAAATHSSAAATTSQRRYRIDGPAPHARFAFEAALDMTTDAVFFLTADLRIIDVNAAATATLGYRPAEFRTMCLPDVVAEKIPGRLQAARRRLLNRQALMESLPGRQRAKSGHWLPVRIRLQRVEGEFEPLLVAVAQVRNRRSQRPLSSANDRDYLTALPSRAALDARLGRAERRARRGGGRFAVLFIDVDRFKSVNDANGHRTGDLVLRTFGQRLLACVRPGDFVARYGGDEFVALVEDVRSSGEVERIAARIRADLGAPIHVPGGTLRVSASVGVAIGRATSSAERLLDEADKAMYQDKRGSAGVRRDHPHQAAPRAAARRWARNAG